MSLIAGIGAVAGGVIGGSIAGNATLRGSAEITSAIDAASARIGGSIDALEETVKRTGRDITAELEKLHVDFSTAFHLSTERSRALEEEIEVIKRVQDNIAMDNENLHRLNGENYGKINYYEEKLKTGDGIGTGMWEVTEEFARQQIEKHKKKIAQWDEELKRNETEYKLWNKKKEYVEQELEKERKRLCEIRGELSTAEETKAELEEAFRRMDAENGLDNACW
jgi:chromosome segregation ATPase